MRKVRLAASAACLILALLLSLGGAARLVLAAPGDLDPGFGSGGKVLTDFGPGSIDQGNAVAVLPSGKVLVAGASDSDGTYDFTLVRYNADGTLDGSFGSFFGLPHVNFGGNAAPQAMALQADGAAVLAGFAVDGSGFGDTALTRILPDGSTDPNFGNAGKSVNSFAVIDSAEAVLIQPDNSILVAGYADNGGQSSFLVARYSSAGQLDTTFGTSPGFTTISFGGDNAYAYALERQSDGSILVAGQEGNAMEVVRLDATGQIDNSFGNGGKVAIYFSGGTDEARAVRQDGSYILVAGTAGFGADRRFALARLNLSNGSLDGNFGAGSGIVTTPFPQGVARAKALDIQNGAIVLAGSDGPDSTSNFALARYSEVNGALDLTFGANGLATVSFTKGARANGLAFSGNKIVAAGTVDTFGQDFALVRLSTDGKPDASFSDDGKQSSDLLPLLQSANAVALAPGGEIVVAGVVDANFVIFGAHNGDFAVARYANNGTLDSTFNGTGRAQLDFGGYNEAANAVLVQPADSKIVLAGSGALASGDGRIQLARYNADGTLDSSFNGNGQVITSVSGDSFSVNGAILQADGKIVVGGYAYRTNNQKFYFLLARYTTAGKLDNTFGTNGLVETPASTGYNSIFSLALQADGKILAGGQYESSPNNQDLIMLRYTSDGKLDPSFSGDGKAGIDFGDNEYGGKVIIQGNKAVIQGSSIPNSGADKLDLARFNLSDGSPDMGFGQSGKVAQLFGLGQVGDGLLNAIGLPDHRIAVAGYVKADMFVALYNEDGSPSNAFGGAKGYVTTDFSNQYSSADALAVQPNGMIIAVGGANDSHSRSLFALTRYQAPAAAPVNTATKTATSTVTKTATKSVTSTATLTATKTATGTASRTATKTPISTATKTVVSTATKTVVSTATKTVVSTATKTATETATQTAMVTKTATKAATRTATTTPIGAATKTPNTTGPTATPCGASFSDVAASDYFYQPVRYLYCAGVISGYADNTFRPFNNTTRGQLAKIVVGVEGWALDTSGGPHFSDVPTSNAFYGVIETAYNRGVISGYDLPGGQREFRWGKFVTRGQLSKIIVKAEGWVLLNPATATFVDVASTNTFYREIETAFAHGIISGYNGPGGREFRCGNNATRAQISKIFYLAAGSGK